MKDEDEDVDEVYEWCAWWDGLEEGANEKLEKRSSILESG